MNVTVGLEELRGVRPRATLDDVAARAPRTESAVGCRTSSFATLDELGDDTKTAALAAFASQGTADVIALEIAIHDNDVRAVKFACHRLRGSSLSIGATVLAAACGQLELNAAGGRRSRELLANVRRQFDAVIVEIATELSSTREASETVT